MGMKTSCHENAVRIIDPLWGEFIHDIIVMILTILV